MFDLIKRYMDHLTIDQVNDFAMKNNIILSSEELTFTYSFVKKNWEQILKNPNSLNLERYKKEFTDENFHKIEKF